MHRAGGCSTIVNHRFMSMGWGWMTTCTHTRTRELTSVLVASAVPKKIEQLLLHHSLSPSADKPQIECSGQPRYWFARSRQPQYKQQQRTRNMKPAGVKRSGDVSSSSSLYSESWRITFITALAGMPAKTARPTRPFFNVAGAP